MTSSDPFLTPRYDSGGFASLPGRVREAFASAHYDAVVLFLVDGFGWRFAQRFSESPFLKRLTRRGSVEKLTSQFPSTTAAHVTTLHTGLTVGQSGVYEWFYYEPKLDAIIAPLLFSYAGDKDRDTLKRSGVKAEQLIPSGSHYRSLKEAGVRSHVFGVRDYTPSTYSKAVMRGAEMQSFRTLAEALVNLGTLLEKETKPAYVNLYFDRIDGLCHEYGPAAPQTEAEIEVFLLIMEHFFERVFTGRKRVLFLMTADHGVMGVDPKRTVYLNVGGRFEGLERFLRTDGKGRPLVPAGSPRDMFLYIKEGMLEEARAFLSRRLEGTAEVRVTAEMAAQGYFGPEISPEFRGRVGDLVILPQQGESMWWYVRDRFEQNYFGHHGGLSPEEMEIPFFRCEV